MREGFGAVRAVLERSRGGDGEKIHWITWKKDGESKVIRFLNSSPTVVDMHSNVLCQDGKRRSFVCRNDQGLVEDFPDEFPGGDCEICEENCTKCGGSGQDPKGKDGKCEHCKGGGSEYWHRERTWAPAIERIEVEEADGTKHYADATREVVLEGQEEPALVPLTGIIVQSGKNFWGYFDTYHQKFGTICDQDFDITRRGTDLTTEYPAFPKGQMRPEDARKLFEASEIDPDGEHPWEDFFARRFADYMPDVKAEIRRQAGREFYDALLHGKTQRKPADPAGNGKTETAEAKPEEPAGEPAGEPAESASERMKRERESLTQGSY